MKIKVLFNLLASLSLSFLIYLIAKSPLYSIYDESIFVENLKLLEKLGLNNTFLISLKNQSPGPLYQIIHSIFSPIGNNSMIGMRLINLGLFLLTMFFTYLILSKKRHAIEITGMYLALPMTWVIVGMALSEIPSMLFCVIFLYLLQLVLNLKYDYKVTQYLIVILAGLALGLSIVGRSPFLMVVAACPVFFLLEDRRILTITLIVSSVILPAYLFTQWGGLVPPDVQGIQSGINPMYLFLALGYMAFLTLIIAHEWYNLPKEYFIYTIIITIIFIILNINFHFISSEPLKSFSDKYFSSQVISIYKYMIPGITMGLGLFYLSSCAFHMITNRKDVFFLFNLVAGLLILMTTIKSSAQFSSRYVIQASPFFLLAYADYVKLNVKTFSLQIIGTLLGILSLVGYYRL